MREREGDERRGWAELLTTITSRSKMALRIMGTLVNDAAVCLGGVGQGMLLDGRDNGCSAKAVVVWKRQALLTMGLFGGNGSGKGRPGVRVEQERVLQRGHPSQHRVRRTSCEAWPKARVGERRG